MYVYHQNMRNYGGASVKRNLQFIRAFHEINAMQPSECLIAGCTEMLNAKTAATNSLSLGHSLSQLLDTELYIWVGSTTGGQTAGRTEYISILYNLLHHFHPLYQKVSFVLMVSIFLEPSTI